MTPDERGLFKERIKTLDKKILPGLGKLTWDSKGISEVFVSECRIQSKKVRSLKLFLDIYFLNVLSI